MRRKILDACLKIAMAHLHKHVENYRHFTFIIQKNRIIEWGVNRRGSPMILRGYDKHTKIHSEMDAYSKARGIMDITIPFEAINIRITKTGTIVNSRPCSICLKLLRVLDCKRIWYTTNEGLFERINIS